MSSGLLFMLLLCGLGIGGNIFSEALPICIRGACGYCPFGFSLYDSHCYMYRDTEKSWDDAEAFCNLFGAHLTSIQGQDQYNFIRNLIRQTAGTDITTWVGGTDLVQPGQWTWIDGSPFTFTSWGPGEPNNAGGNEHCMEINLNGQDYVNDADCSLMNPFVCAKNDP